MSELIVIDGKEYAEYTEQEPKLYKINKYTLTEWTKIFPKHYCEIKPFFNVRYIHKETQTYSDGILIKYIQPDIFILKNNTYYIWNICLDDYDIYLKNIAKIRKENKQKNNLWHLFQEGLIKILDSPEQ